MIGVAYLVGIIAFIVDTIVSKQLKKLNNFDELDIIMAKKKKVFMVVRGICIALMIAVVIYLLFTLL